MKISRHILTMTAALASSLLFSCSEDRLTRDDDNAIRFVTDVPATRATIFEDLAGLYDTSKDGGSFAAYAYVAGNGTNGGKTYIEDEKVIWFTDKRYWTFADENGVHYNHFWPKNDKLNFFAHMPRNKESAGVTAINYTPGKGPSFSFRLPMDAGDNPDQEELREFIYAYTPDQEKQDEGVPLSFQHPFAAVYINLGTSYRMTLNSITIGTDTKGLQYSGTYEYDGNAWTLNSDGNEDKLIIRIGKGIPEEINFNSPIGGPYIVMPQSLTDLQLVANVTRLDAQGAEDLTINLATASVDSWEAGNRYTYTLGLGQADEEILFKVEVEPWNVMDYKHMIDVE